MCAPHDFLGAWHGVSDKTPYFRLIAVTIGSHRSLIGRVSGRS